MANIAELGLKINGLNQLDQLTSKSDKASTSATRLDKNVTKATGNQKRFASAAQNASYQIGDFAVQIASGGSAVTALAQQLPQLLGGFGLFGAAAGAGVAIAGALWNTVANSGSADAALQRQNDLLDEMAKKYEAVSRAIKQVEEAATFRAQAIDVDRLNLSVKDVSESLSDARNDLRDFSLSAVLLVRGGTSEELRKFSDRVRDLAEDMRSGKISVTDFAVSLTEIATNAPTPAIAEMARGIRDSASAAIELEAQLSKLSATQQTVTATTVALTRAQIMQAGTAMLRVGAAFDASSDAMADYNKHIAEVERETQKRAAAIDKAQNAEESFEQAIQKKLSALELEQSTLGMSAYATAELTHQQELYNLATQKGIELTPQLKSRLDGIAASMASMSVSTSEAKEQLDFAKGSTRGFLGDLYSGLKSGEGAWHAFGNAAQGVLDRIVDKLLDNVVDALFTVGKAGSRLGGGGSIFGSLFGGIGRLFGFASGGYTGNMGASSVAGVVHGGEYVFSKKATDKIGVGNLERMHQSAKGYASGGLVTPANNNSSGGSMDIRVVVGFEEETLAPAVRSISQQESAKAGNAAYRAAMTDVRSNFNSIATQANRNRG